MRRRVPKLPRDPAERIVREMVTGRHGVLRIDADAIEAELFSFDGFFQVREDAPVVLLADDADFVTLHSIYSHGALGRTMGSSATVVHNQSIGANYVVSGPEQWGADARLKCATFIVPGADMLLRHQSTYDAVRNSEAGSLTNTEAVRVVADDVTIAVHYAISGSFDALIPTKVWPVVTMEFVAPSDHEGFLREANALETFLSSCMCRWLQLDDVVFTKAAQRAGSGAGAVADHRVAEPQFRFLFLRNEHASREAEWVGRSYALASDDGERAAFEACLGEWFGRRREWDAANQLMMNALALSNTASPERLLNACKWLESTPGAGARRALSDDHVARIARAALAEAATLGHDALGPRIRGALRLVGSESNADRWSRLIDEARASFGDHVIGEGMLDDLRHAYALRGGAAHSHLELGAGEAFHDYLAAVAAVECLSYLLMLLGLPMTDEGRLRVERSAFVRAHLQVRWSE